MHDKNWQKKFNTKNLKKKKKVTLSSLEYSISLGEDLNWHMPSPILAYPFLIFLTKLCILISLVG